MNLPYNIFCLLNFDCFTGAWRKGFRERLQSTTNKWLKIENMLFGVRHLLRHNILFVVDVVDQQK